LPVISFDEPTPAATGLLWKGVSTMNQIAKPGLLSVEDANRLNAETVANLMAKHMSPGQLHFLKLLGFDRVLIDRAEGVYYFDQSGRKILDFFGGFGSLALGHNHPRILAVRRQFAEEKRHEIAMAFMSQYAAVLSYDLAEVAPGDLDIVFLCVSGSEANEAALKLAERAAGRRHQTVVYAENSFHGKTRAALSVTDSEFYQADFQLLENRRRVPFGDAAALERAFAADHSIGVLVLETVQGGAGIIVPPRGYLKAVRRLCDEYGVLWIADEVQCGYGRTGRFFAFEHEDVVPDIVTLAKSLGGGKTAIGAYIARTPVFMVAYGTPATALIHGPATFSGLGEACATAIEALRTLYEEGLIDNAAEQGAYLLDRLRDIQVKYPTMIDDVRGLGCMVGLEIADVSQALPHGVQHLASVLDNKLKGSLCGFIGSLLLRDYDVLVAFTEYNRNVIRLEPPLIVERAHVDRFVDSLDDLLSRGLTRIVMDYIRNAIKKPVKESA
jgi:acetylornithine/succinyldiaminopimelate/putrescine aminotransferase